MAKNLSIVAQGISGAEGKLLGYNVTDNGIYTPAIGDVARDTTATYVAQDGTIKTAAENVARVDYTNGVAELLLEPESTNLLPYSENFSQGIWNGETTFSLTSSLAPNGNSSVYKLTPNVSGNSTTIGNASTNNRAWTPYFGITDPATIANSIYVKSVSGLDFEFSLFVQSSDAIKSIKTITVNNQWQRVGASINNIDLSGNGRFTMCTEEEVLIWGAQVEEQPQATSYIPTNGAIATRGADSMTNFGSEHIIDSESGILFFEGSAFIDSLVNRGFSISKDGGNRIYCFFQTNGAVSARAIGGGVSSNITESSIDVTLHHKYVLRYSQTNFQLIIDGVVYGDVSFNGIGENVLSTLGFNTLVGSTSYFYGRVRQLKHLPYNTDITTL